VRRQDVERTELLARTLTASDRDRRAIAADVHDGPVQELAGVAYALSALRPTVPSAAQGATDRLIGSVKEGVAALRTLMVDLYPPDLSASAMPAALEDLARRMSTATLTVHSEATAVPDLDSPGAAVLYRTAKEALAVVPRPATSAWLSYEPASMGGAPAALLRVSHDGPPASVHPTGARSDDLEGLDLMRRELVDLGGSLTVTDHDGSGAVVTALVPVGATPHSGGPPPPHRGLRRRIRDRKTVLAPLPRQPPEPSRTQ
jgi:signal transduction histidine kinase